MYFFSFFREHIVIQHHTKCHLVPSECFTWTTYKYHSSNPWRQCGCNYSPPRHGDVMPFARLGPDDDLVDLPRLTKLFANILFSAWEASAFEDNLFRFFYARWVVLQLFGAGKLDIPICWMFVLRKDVSIISNINTYIYIQIWDQSISNNLNVLYNHIAVIA